MGKRQLTHEEFMQRVVECNDHVRSGQIEVRGTYVNYNTPIECYCRKHDVRWYPYAESLYRGTGCRKCGVEKVSEKQRKTHDQFVAELREFDDSIVVLSEYRGLSSKITVQFKCGHIVNIRPQDLLSKHHGCPYCVGQAILVGFNDLATVRPDIASLLADPNDGYKYTGMSGKKVKFKCPDCGYVQEKFISNIARRGWSCRKCGQNLSYPEKLMRAVLNSLNIKDYDVEWNPTWVKPYRYDFHIKVDNHDFVIEVDGGYHFLQVTASKLSLEERQAIDHIKDQLAVDHNVTMIRIDAKFSECDYIKRSILNSKLNDLFDLSVVDWKECDAVAQKNLVKIVCEYYMQTHDTSKNVAKHFKLASSTVVKYLKRGAELGWCDYDPKQHIGFAVVSVPVSVFNIQTQETHVFQSKTQCIKVMREQYNVVLKSEQITQAWKSMQPYKGFIFNCLKTTIQN